MKPDTQHLDFLISQYVDGTLDAVSKKSVEQQLVNDPAGRKLYAEHREVQDLLDDWGDRIPLVNWGDFDKKLAVRLDKETIGSERNFLFRKWMRPVAAAAALIVAALVGYSWNAMWGGKVGPTIVNSNVTVMPARTVATVVDEPLTTMASRVTVRVMEEQAFASSGNPGEKRVLVVSAPENAAAVESLKDSLAYGMRSLSQSVQPARGASSTVSIRLGNEKVQEDRETVYP